MIRIDLFHPIRRQEPATMQDYVCVVAGALGVCAVFTIIAVIVAIVTT
jgi:hypothetical protein